MFSMLLFFKPLKPSIIGSNLLLVLLVQKMGILMRTKEFLVKLKIINLQPNSLYRAACFANFEGILGFSVPSII